jgi:heme O synthase-like polyprenyltransferase
MNKNTLRVILGYLIIALVVLVTLKYVKLLPAILKVLALAANLVTIYFAYNYFINLKNKKEKDGN